MVGGEYRHLILLNVHTKICMCCSARFSNMCCLTQPHKIAFADNGLFDTIFRQKCVVCDHPPPLDDDSHNLSETDRPS